MGPPFEQGRADVFPERTFGTDLYLCVHLPHTN